VLTCSLLWSVAMLVTRRLAGVDRPGITLFWTAATGFVLFMAALPFNLAPIGGTLAGLCVVLGVVATAGQWLAILAYRHARASALAPLSYAQLIWASGLGWLVFGTLPDRWVLLGACVIAGSGLYVVQMERRRVSSAPSPASGRGPG